ncbi:hypothetical protein GS921_25620 [Rhodococcus hoagii]|nr:hypothetical protein [Prescottella equi]
MDASIGQRKSDVAFEGRSLGSTSWRAPWQPAKTVDPSERSANATSDFRWPDRPRPPLLVW